jgi:hypothetical protein
MEFAGEKPLSKPQLKNPGSSLKVWSRMSQEEAKIVWTARSCLVFRLRIVRSLFPYAAQVQYALAR